MWIEINIRYEDHVRVEVTDKLTEAEIQEVAEEVALGLSNIITAEHVSWTRGEDKPLSSPTTSVEREGSAYKYYRHTGTKSPEDG